MFPFVSVEEISLPLMVMLSTLKVSILLFASVMIAELAVSVPGTWLNLSVKYLPPTTAMLAATPPVSVPVPI